MSKVRFPALETVVSSLSDFHVKNSYLEHYVFGPSLTRQEMAEDCDINTIMARYEVTGQLPNIDRPAPQYMDVTNAPDLMGALRILDEGREAFMRLPAGVRREFDNDPVAFVAFAQDPDNLDQMRTWGLAPPGAAERPPVADRPISELTASEFAALTREAPKPA